MKELKCENNMYCVRCILAYGLLIRICRITARMESNYKINNPSGIMRLKRSWIPGGILRPPIWIFALDRFII